VISQLALYCRHHSKREARLECIKGFPFLMEGSTPEARIKRAFAGLVSHVLLGKRDEKVILVTKGRSARALF
jgi:hypothetical protein